MARVLGGARLSRKTDESTSLERQTEQITYTAKARGDELIHITEDSDVSGAISPFAREGLGPWLIDPDKIAQWDTLVIAKLDRLTRSLKDFDELVEWLDANGKTLVSVSESLDLSTSTGRMFANLLAMFAQFERERIGERRREAGAKLRENGWWQGGQVNYGFVPVKVDSHWELREDPAAAGIVYRMASEVISGKARRAIARDLDRDGIPTSTGRGKWGERSITLILRADVTVLDTETRQQVLTALDKAKVPYTKRGQTAMLLNVAFCSCGQPMYSRRWVHKPSGKLYEYYGCAEKCGKRNVAMQALDNAVSLYFTESAILESYADYPVYRKVEPKRSSSKAEIAKVERQLRNLDFDAADYAATHAELMAERSRLLDSSTNGDLRARYELLNVTVKDVWPMLGTDAKRALMVGAGIKVTDVTRAGNTAVFSVPVADKTARFVIE